MLELSRTQILRFRRWAGFLEERLAASAKSLSLAAWAGLQDSMPRAALLSLHARVNGCRSNYWEHPSLVQLWGPRYNVYVVTAKDLPVFSLGRLPDNARGRARAYLVAYRLQALLAEQRMAVNQAGKALGVHPNSLRYAAPTGTVVLRWDGAHDAIASSSPPPDMEPRDARLELARRYLHVFGPSTASSFGHWAGIGEREAKSAIDGLARSVINVRTPIGDAWILAQDETAFRNSASSLSSTAHARFLPSGDAYYLLWGHDREVLVPDTKRRAELWTTRVWPGALLVNGEISGVWRRSGTKIFINTWRTLLPSEWESVEAEASSLPLPGPDGRITIHRE
jgi:hypothetical protein